VAKLNARIGSADEAYLRIEVVGYEHPDVAEPAGMDLLRCTINAVAAPVTGTFTLAVRAGEILEVGEYLATINSGNGPPSNFSLGDGLVSLDFAPSRRGPVLCAVALKSIERAHARMEFLVTLEPESITRLLAEFAAFRASLGESP
jgi:hypothetical protein